MNYRLSAQLFLEIVHTRPMLPSMVPCLTLPHCPEGLFLTVGRACSDLRCSWVWRQDAPCFIARRPSQVVWMLRASGPPLAEDIPAAAPNFDKCLAFRAVPKFGGFRSSGRRSLQRYLFLGRAFALRRRLTTQPRIWSLWYIWLGNIVGMWRAIWPVARRRCLGGAPRGQHRIRHHALAI